MKARFLWRSITIMLGAAAGACSVIWDFEHASLAPDDGAADGSPVDQSSESTPIDVAATDGSKKDGSKIVSKQSCSGLSMNCGVNAASDCCTSPLVSGGAFSRSYDGVSGGPHTDPQYTATVSSFRLDTFEVTVGRFRKFVDSYPESSPTPGSGKNPNNASDNGWEASWNVMLPADRTALRKVIDCEPSGKTWTETPSSNETKPMNCVTWFEAFAFCIWDGGRLATEAEWNYAAAGGSEQRAFPWSTPSTSTTIDTTYAVYDFDGTNTARSVFVGSRSPKGDGRWGHADLSGNVWEWVRDGARAPYRMPCVNCSEPFVVDASVMSRGGSWNTIDVSLRTSFRLSGTALFRGYDVGIRCARDP